MASVATFLSIHNKLLCGRWPGQKNTRLALIIITNLCLVASVNHEFAWFRKSGGYAALLSKGAWCNFGGTQETFTTHYNV